MVKTMKSERVLASIQTISNIEKHPNADTLELATILGWQIIVKIGEITLGSKVIYCEIDSLLPVDVEWLPQSVKDRIIREKISDYFRVKTIKLRGELSQGLIIPIVDTLPTVDDWNDGTDVTKPLGIKKYEPYMCNGRFDLRVTNSKVRFPSLILDKTDEQRIQSNPKLLDQIKGKPYNITVKLDGTSATYFIHPETEKFIVCSRTKVRTEPDFETNCPYWLIARKYDIENKLRRDPNLAIQGEICGPHIQHNLLDLRDLDFFIFNVIDLRYKLRLDVDSMIQHCDTVLNIPTVPIEEIGEKFSYDSIKTLLIKANGLYRGTKNPREGLVIRSSKLISFKVINNEYLLKYGY